MPNAGVVRVGEDDKVQSPDARAWAARLLPNGRLETLPGGHGLWLEHPQRCGQLLTAFPHEHESRPK